MDTHQKQHLEHLEHELEEPHKKVIVKNKVVKKVKVKKIEKVKKIIKKPNAQTLQDDTKQKSFLNEIYGVYPEIKLSEKNVYSETPEGMKDKTELYPHQKTLVRAILDLEQQRFVKMKYNKFSSITNEYSVVETNGCVLSEPFGSGKTLIILAVILHRITPRALPENSNIIFNYDEYYYNHCNMIKDIKYINYTTEILKKYSRILRPNIIFVGKSVLIQWLEAIKNYTNLRVLVITDVFTLKKFYKYYRNNIINYYDIILVKNGDVTGNFVINGESESEIPSLRSLINVIAKISKGCVWSRVIYDDFDTINISNNTIMINGLFTIFVSATKKQSVFRSEKILIYDNVLDMIEKRSNNILNNVINDKYLFSYFNLRNEKMFTEKSLMICRVNAYKYVYNNRDDNYIKLLGVMGEKDADNIMEMLNGDAVETAAEELGIKSTSIADIFEKMLGKKYDKYLQDGYIIEAIELAITYVNNTVLNRHTKDTYSIIELEEIKSKLIKKESPEFIQYQSDNLLPFLRELLNQYEESRERNGIAVNRVKSNIKEGECQVCLLSLKEMDVFINKCCGLILCDECGVRGTRIQKHYDYKTGRETLCGKCPNCSANVNILNDVIFINREFNIESILNARGDEVKKEPEPEPIIQHVETEQEKKINEITNPKLKALLSIINGIDINDRQKIDLDIKQLLKGSHDVLATKDQAKKILVFANYNETLVNIENMLNNFSIKYNKLQGTYSKVAEIIKEFRDNGNLLLINSSETCAGLNLHFATDLVFFHKIMDPNIESQVAGRAQRIGRTCNLNIHYLLYKNEKN